MAEPRLLTAKDAAAYVGMTEGAFRKLHEQRRVPFVRLGARSIRFDRHELDRWIDEHSVQAVAR